MPQNGTSKDYINWAEKIDFVKKAFIKPTPGGIPGTVGFTFLSNKDRYSVPDKDQWSEVERELQRLSPASVQVSYLPPVERVIAIEFTLTKKYSLKDDGLRKKVEKDILDYFEKELSVSGFVGPDNKQVNRVVNRNKIVRILEKHAGYNTELDSPSENIKLEEFEFARPRFKKVLLELMPPGINWQEDKNTREIINSCALEMSKCYKLGLNTVRSTPEKRSVCFKLA